MQKLSEIEMKWPKSYIFTFAHFCILHVYINYTEMSLVIKKCQVIFKM